MQYLNGSFLKQSKFNVKESFNEPTARDRVLSL